MSGADVFFPYQTRGEVDHTLSTWAGAQTTTVVALRGPRSAGKKTALLQAIGARAHGAFCVILRTPNQVPSQIRPADLMVRASQSVDSKDVGRRFDLMRSTIEIVDAAATFVQAPPLLSLFLAIARFCIDAGRTSDDTSTMLVKLAATARDTAHALAEFLDLARGQGRPFALVVDDWQRVQSPQDRYWLFSLLAHCRRTDAMFGAPVLAALVMDEEEERDAEPNLQTDLMTVPSDVPLVSAQLALPNRQLLAQALAQRHGATRVEKGLARLLVGLSGRRWRDFARLTALLERGGALDVNRTRSMLDLMTTTSRAVAAVDLLLSDLLPADSQTDLILRAGALEGMVFTESVVARVLGLTEADVGGRLEVIRAASLGRTGVPTVTEHETLPLAVGERASVVRWRFGTRVLRRFMLRRLPRDEQASLSERMLAELRRAYGPYLYLIGRELATLAYRAGRHREARWYETVVSRRNWAVEADILDRFEGGTEALSPLVGEALLSQGFALARRRQTPSAIGFYLLAHVVAVKVDEPAVACKALWKAAEHFATRSPRSRGFADVLLAEAERWCTSERNSLDIEVVKTLMDESRGELDPTRATALHRRIGDRFTQLADHSNATMEYLRATESEWRLGHYDEARRDLGQARNASMKSREPYYVAARLVTEARLAEQSGDNQGFLEALEDAACVAMADASPHLGQIGEIALEFATAGIGGHVACCDRAIDLISAWPPSITAYEPNFAHALVYCLASFHLNEDRHRVAETLRSGCFDVLRNPSILPHVKMGAVCIPAAWALWDELGAILPQIPTFFDEGEDVKWIIEGIRDHMTFTVTVQVERRPPPRELREQKCSIVFRSIRCDELRVELSASGPAD